MAISNLEDWLYTAFSREHNGVYDGVKLDPVRKILCHLNCKIRPITVAGTKGKGSTVRFIEAGLIAANKTCLAFTSPHVQRINERWRVNGQPLDDKRLLQAAEDIEAAEQSQQQPLTYFERCFMIAALIAEQDQLDYFLCEVGLGGRLDCANALDTQLGIITALSYDHCHILGNTLTEIAYEKCAIARKDAPLIIAPQSADAEKAIAEQQLHAASVINCTTRVDLRLSMPGDHQHSNASAAIAALRILLPEITEDIFIPAIEQVQLSARCQIIQDGSRSILVDAGHNGASIKACINVANEKLSGDWVIVLGCMQDKQIEDILSELPVGHDIIRCGFDWPRARGANDWPNDALTWPYADNISAALDQIATDRDMCICGSFYLAGEALELLSTDNTIPG